MSPPGRSKRTTQRHPYAHHRQPPGPPLAETAQASFTDTVLEKTQASGSPGRSLGTDLTSSNTTPGPRSRAPPRLTLATRSTRCLEHLALPAQGHSLPEGGLVRTTRFPPLSISRLSLLPWLQISHANKSASKCSPVGPPFLPRLGS